MSPRRRTFSFILIFISLNERLALCQTVAPGIPQNVVPSPKEYVPSSGSPNSQLINNLISIASANGILSNVLPAIQRIFPETQNLVINEGIPQPLPLEAPNGRSCQQRFTPSDASNTNSLPSNTGIPNPYPAPPKLAVNEGILPPDLTKGRSCQQCFTPNSFVTTLTLPYPIPQSNLGVSNSPIQSAYSISPPTVLPPPYPPQPSPLPPPACATPYSIPQQAQTIPPVPTTDQNCNYIGPLSVGPVRPQLEKQGDIYPPNCLQPEIIQPQFNYQMPQILPAALPITRPPVLPNIPSNHIMLESQNIGSWPYFPEPILTSNPIEVPVANVGSDCGQQLPISLQINMPAPVQPEPIITVISTPPSPSQFSSSSYDMPSYPMPYPSHIVEKSKSKWKRWLPIMLLALLDGGCRKNCGGGCSGCQRPSNIPIPYPIPVPTNNAIVLGRQN